MSGLSLQRPCFQLGPFRVGFMVGKVALEQVPFFHSTSDFPPPLLFNQYSILIFVCGQSLETFQQKLGSGFEVFLLWLSLVINWLHFLGRQLLIQTCITCSLDCARVQRWQILLLGARFMSEGTRTKCWQSFSSCSTAW